MRNLLTTCLFLLLASGVGAQPIIYVNDNASGANDGSSWSNAFTSLDAALAAASTGNQIWVAAGIYKPGNAAPNNSFIVRSGISVFGSFAGTETSPLQRDIEANPSLLSGDINGDDIPGNFDTNRSDNVIHVVRTQNGVATERAIIDGFVISGGSTLLGSSDPAIMKRGGGILVEAQTTVINCTIRDCKAESGGGISASGVTTNNLIVKKCLIEKNTCSIRAAGIYILNVNGVEVDGCIFRENKTIRGALYPRTSTNVSITNCLFENNSTISDGDFSSSIYALTVAAVIDNCQFKKNRAGSAPGIYVQNQQSNNLVEIRNCSFEENESLDYGGCGIYSFDGNYTAENCTFLNNTAISSAGGVYNGGATTFSVKNAHFEGNKSNYAAAVANYGIGVVGTFDNCTFRGNTAQQGGGACSNGFKTAVSYKHCKFETNSAAFGGAIFTQNDTTRLTVDGCEFIGNSANDGSGGAVYKNFNIAVVIKNSKFADNVANVGAGIFARGDSVLWVENTQFVNNIALEQGVAVNLSNTPNAVFVNTLMGANNNYSTELGAGGALLNNASGKVTSTVKMINCTIADNFSPLGSGLSQWEDDTSNAVMILQNCILQNTVGENYAIEAGEPEVISLGGNQATDETLKAYLTGAKDLNNTTNEFKDAGVFDYHLLPGPAVNGGVATGAPTTDLEGKPRTGLPDVGAYEYSTVGVFQPGMQALPLKAVPNPVVDRTVISLNHPWTGEANLELYNAAGKLIRSFSVVKTSQNWQMELNISDLPVGNYHVRLLAGSQAFKTVVAKVHQ